MKLSRRRLALGSLGAAVATFVTGAGTTLRRRFLFVHAEGGWDPLAVFAPLFDAPNIDMEAGSQPLGIGDFALVDAASRPSVPAFFQRWGGRTLVLDGLSTRSVNHETCQAVALTGSTSDAGTDWATVLAADVLADHYLPHVVLNGPSFAGASTIAVNRAEGLVQGAIAGFLLDEADVPLRPPTDMATTSVDAYLRDRSTALREGMADAPTRATFAQQYDLALNRSHQLVQARDAIQLGYAPTLSGRAQAAINLFATDVSRCASISTGFAWDTHADNSIQAGLFQDFFTELDLILTALETTPCPRGGMLLDSTVVVVLSEMGRTPAFNGTGGRDHWPYTTAMLIGSGVAGGRAVGGYTDLYAGVGIDPATGEPDPSRAGIDAGSLGATLLALGDVDPAAHLTNPTVLTGLLT